MKSEYLNENVYEALQRRLKFLFEEFDNIFVSFSGGKDSGLLLNLVLDFQKAHYPDKRIGVFHQDFEAQYSATTEYVERTFARIEKDVEPYWVCLPMATRTALSSYEMYWYPWDNTKEEAWIRPMPQHKYVINIKNNPMTTYRYRMHQEDLAKQFGRWYRIAHGNKKTVCLLGIRADESLQRYSGFLNRKYGYKETCWISNQFKNVWVASPIYDWSTSDVWHANYTFQYDYNSLYDLYYMAGLKPDQMRVASPFNDYAKDSLNLYRVIDPQIWVKLIGRVRGANFGAIYGKTKAMGYKNITLPEGHEPTYETPYTKSQTPLNGPNNTRSIMANSPITDVIFDFCGVLLDWNTRACLEGRFPDEIVERICADDDPCGFFRYEDRMDTGEDFADIYPDVVREQGQELADIFKFYIGHYADALPRTLPGMVELLADLKAHGYGVWGLTNWSHETFHLAFEKYPRLEQLLQGTVVSGVEKMHKPNADIYELALTRFGLTAERCVFFDDTAKNIVGANEVGIHGILFENALQARESLAELGVRL